MILRMRVSVCFCLSAMLLVPCIFCVAQETPPASGSAVVFAFAIAGVPVSASPGPASACPADAAALPVDEMDDAQKVVNAIAQEMRSALLQHHVTAQLAQSNQPLTPGTLVFSGCLTGLKRGSAAARSVSLGVGGSQIATHVRTFTAGPNGEVTNLREYDLVTKGTNYGGGLIVGLARAKRTSVEGDGRHAADQIVEKYFADPGNSSAATPAKPVPAAVNSN